MQEAVGDHRPGAVYVDLAKVTFLDSSGISVLIQARNAAEQITARFAVERPIEAVFDQPNMAGLVELFGLSQSSRAISGLGQ